MPRPPLRGENVTASEYNYVHRIEDAAESCQNSIPPVPPGGTVV